MYTSCKDYWKERREEIQKKRGNVQDEYPNRSVGKYDLLNRMAFCFRSQFFSPIIPISFFPRDIFIPSHLFDTPTFSCRFRVIS